MSCKWKQIKMLCSHYNKSPPSRLSFSSGNMFFLYLPNQWIAICARFDWLPLDIHWKMARLSAKVSEEEIVAINETAFFYPSDLVNTKTTIPLRVCEERWIYTLTLRVSVYIQHYSSPLRGIVVYHYKVIVQESMNDLWCLFFLLFLMFFLFLFWFCPGNTERVWVVLFLSGGKHWQWCLLWSDDQKCMEVIEWVHCQDMKAVTCAHILNF